MWSVINIVVSSILCFAKGEETLRGQVLRKRIREHTNVDLDYNVRQIDESESTSWPTYSPNTPWPTRPPWTSSPTVSPRPTNQPTTRTQSPTISSSPTVSYQPTYTGGCMNLTFSMLLPPKTLEVYKIMWYVSSDEIDFDWFGIDDDYIDSDDDYIDVGIWGPIVYDIEWDGKNWDGSSTYLPNTILVEHSNGTNTNEQKLCIPEGDYTFHARVSGEIRQPGSKQLPFHGNTALVDYDDGVPEEGFGVNNSWFILSSGDDNIACGDLLSGWEDIAEENRYVDGYNLQFTLPPNNASGINATSSSSSSCFGIDDGVGRNDIALKTLQCYYSAFDYDFDPDLRNELLNLDKMINLRIVNPDMWFSEECGQLLSNACNNRNSLGFTDDQMDEFCAYHQCAIDKRSAYYDNSSHECECLYNQWDCKYGRMGCTKESLRGTSLECCGNTGNSCICMLKPLCMDGDMEMCGDYASNCCAEGNDNCKCDYSTKSCIGQLQDENDSNNYGGSCMEADMSCAQCDGFYGLGGCSGSIINHCERGCDYWTNLCLEYPGVSCDIAAGKSVYCFIMRFLMFNMNFRLLLLYLTLGTSFELNLPLLDCLCEPYVLTEVTIISLSSS